MFLKKEIKNIVKFCAYTIVKNYAIFLANLAFHAFKASVAFVLNISCFCYVHYCSAYKVTFPANFCLL